jgi:hypothetical protein
VWRIGVFYQKSFCCGTHNTHAPWTLLQADAKKVGYSFKSAILKVGSAPKSGFRKAVSGVAREENA